VTPVLRARAFFPVLLALGSCRACLSPTFASDSEPPFHFFALTPLLFEGGPHLFFFLLVSHRPYHAGREWIFLLLSGVQRLDFP